MAYKDILVYLDPTSEAEARLRLALELATTHGAQLIGVEASMRATLVGDWAKRAEAIRLAFEDGTRSARLKSHFAPSTLEQDGERFSHCVDLILAPAPDGQAREFVRRDLLDRALIDSGAPMLILPPDWKSGPVGETIVIAWNAGREALRAVHDAMPFLQRAAKVTVFTFSARPSALRASADLLAEHLARHGVKAGVSDWTNTGDLTAVDALFADLDSQDADLIVAGAFSHSRFYEGVFGGVSLDLMRQQSLPVLMSH
jgi:nucleotide-binding universal stress UspA family protein